MQKWAQANKQQATDRLLQDNLDKRIQTLIEETKAKQRLGYKKIKDSGQPTKFIIVNEQTAPILEWELLKHLKRGNKLKPIKKFYWKYKQQQI